MDTRPLIKFINANKTFWTFCGLLLLVNIAVYFLYVRNGSEAISRLQYSYRTQRKQMAEQFRAQAENQAYAKAVEAIDRFWGGVGSRDQFPEQVRKLKSLTESRQLTVDRIAFSPTELKEQGVWRYETLLTARGGYGQLKGLLADIQDLEGLFCLETFSMTRDRAGEPITMKAKVAIYLTESPSGV
ncbi:MAG: hypothetical protein ACOWWM_10725 [Desulfobacterales bacterium]